MREAATARRQRMGARRAAVAEQEEAALDELIAEGTAVTRTNAIAIASPKGAVGKTTCTFLLGNVLAGSANLRCVAVDLSPDHGMLGSLAPPSSSAAASLADVLAGMDRIVCAAELKPLVASLPTGLDLIAAPRGAEAMDALTPELYTRLTDFLSRFYDVMLLDLGSGMGDPLQQLALERADQSMVVSTPDFVTASAVLDALRHLRSERLTVVLNQAPRLPDDAARQEIADELARHDVDGHVVLPYDDRLRAMLESASYDLGTLDRATRMSIKRLGRCAARWLV